VAHILNVIVVGQQKKKNFQQDNTFVIEAEESGQLLVQYLKNVYGVRYLIMEEEENYKCSCSFASYSNDSEQKLILNFSKNQMEHIKKIFEQLINDSPSKCLIIYLETNRIVTLPDKLYPVNVDITFMSGLKNFWLKYENGEIVENVLFIVSNEEKKNPFERIN